MPASKNEEKNIPAKTGAGTGIAPVKAFTGGDQGFISLLLESVENVSHNTKKFRFKLNDEDSTSGLPVASALLTKFKGPDMEKPVVRPYTPVSDEGTASPPHAHILAYYTNDEALWQTRKATSTSSSKSTPTAPCPSTYTP